MTNPHTLPSTHEVQSAILQARGTRAVLAEDLAQFYEISVSAFNQARACNSNSYRQD